MSITAPGRSEIDTPDAEASSQHDGDEVEQRVIDAFAFLRENVAVLTFFATVAAAFIYGFQLSVMRDQQTVWKAS